MMNTDYIALAQELGFTEAAFFDPKKLSFEDCDILRDGCKANDCGFYGRYWTCPPGVGSTDKVAEKIKSYDHGLILQMITEAVSCDLQQELFDDISHTFNDMTAMVKEELLKEVDSVFMLGMSNCTICEECTYPHEKCRHPEKMIPCISGHCVNVYRLWDSTGHRRADLSESDFYSILLWND